MTSHPIDNDVRATAVRALSLAACAGGILLGVAGGIAEAAAPFVLATPEPQGISCEDTPFGMSAPLTRNIEPFYFERGTGGQMLDEFRSAAPWEDDPLHRVYRAPLIQAGIPDRSWREAVKADLDGDGRDELVAAFSDGGDVRVVVYGRASGLEPTARVIDEWSRVENVVADSIDLRAGDFDGSTDGKQELALSWQTGGTTRVVFLTGSGDGGIAEANGATAGSWTAPGGSGLRPRLAAGDFLLDGRDQIVLVGMINEWSPSAATLTLDLVEFDTEWPAGVLERRPGSSGNVGSKRFGNNVTALAVESGSWSNHLVEWLAGERLAADGADLVDSAAAELVVHVGFQVKALATASRGRGLAQRLFHFDTERGAGNAITGISLGNGGQYDASRIVTRYTPLTFIGQVPPAPAFDTALVDIDGLPPLEIVTLEAGREADSSAWFDDGPLRWWAHHAYVRLASGFSYQNIGASPGNPNLRSVRFRSLAHGTIAQYEWDFGGGATSQDPNPIRDFPVGDRAVRLRVTAPNGVTSDYTMIVHVGGSDGSFEPAYVYGIDPDPIYRGRDTSVSYASTSLAGLAAGDIDNNGIPEVLTVARDAGGTLHRHVWNLETVASGTFAYRKTTASAPDLTALGLVASDFDGNSVHASLGIDCRRVTDRLARTLTWLPPYFTALQDEVYMRATYGMTTSGASGYEKRSGSYFSHDVSGYVGVNHEISLLGVLKIAEWSVKVTAGHNWQAEKGRFSGSESEYSINDGASMYGNGALVEVESHQSDCYSYDVENAEGPIPGSALRMCEVLPFGSAREATDVISWNSLENEPRPVVMPLHWVPLQRDWASIALFRPVAASSVITFPPGKEAEKVTDGLFSTSAESSQATTRPYLELDLGSVRDIGAIRVFPSAGRQKQFIGYRIYASQAPFAGPGVPAGAGVREFRQNTGDTESTYGTWNLWTRDPMDPASMLRARYLRLQYPGGTPVELHVAEIQVFGETLQEPPAYPDAVCDPAVGDGHFLGKVWDPVGLQYRNIELRGDLIWSGSDDTPIGGVPGAYDSGVTRADGSACYNGMDNDVHALWRRVAQYAIWRDRAVGASGSVSWDLDASTTQTSGNYSSRDSATRIGAEFEANAGIGTTVMVGAAYEFTFGATQEFQSSFSWGSGLAIGGEVGGFINPPPGVIDQCKYFPRPYAYNVRETSNVGFAQDMYVTDYVVKHVPRGAGAWQRNAVPATCYGGTLADAIFADGFEP